MFLLSNALLCLAGLFVLSGLVYEIGSELSSLIGKRVRHETETSFLEPPGQYSKPHKVISCKGRGHYW